MRELLLFLDASPGGLPFDIGLVDGLDGAFSLARRLAARWHEDDDPDLEWALHAYDMSTETFGGGTPYLSGIDSDGLLLLAEPNFASWLIARPVLVPQDEET